MAWGVAALVAIRVASSVMQGQSQARQLGESAGSLEDQALEAIALGRRRAAAVRRKGKAIGGEIRALAGAAGLELSGSVMAVEVHSAMNTERHASNLIHESTVYAQRLRAEAGRRRGAARDLRRNLGLSAALTGLSGAQQGGFFSDSGGGGGGGGGDDGSEFEPYGE